MSATQLLGSLDRTFTAPYPGDLFLQGSFEGSEPFDEVGAFVGTTDWRDLGVEFLDAQFLALAERSNASSGQRGRTWRRDEHYDLRSVVLDTRTSAAF